MEGAVNQVYRDKTDCTGSTPTYTADIAPVLNSSCAISGCHNSQTRAHNLDLSIIPVPKDLLICIH